MVSSTPNGATARERQALLALVQGSEGIEWSQSRVGWDDTEGSICDWEGITCAEGYISSNKGGWGNIDASTAPQVVAAINLPNSGLAGTLPSELGLLTHLETINLKGNLIRGSIPMEIAQLPNLETVDLSNCSLEGTLPQHWASNKLDSLLLGQNSIGGKFFHDVTSPHLASIEKIDLSQNKLEGTLNGKIIQAMSKLRELGLSQNELSGSLPGKDIGSLSALKYLYLDSNHFVGSLSSSMAQLNKATLEELWLQDNALSGTVPASFVRFNLLHDFFIDGNKFTGMHAEICSANLNSDFIEGESFLGRTSVTVNEKTYCDYIACGAGSISLEGMYPCTKCAGENNRMGKMQPYLGQKGTSCPDWSQREILKLFYQGATKNGPWKEVANEANDWMDDSVPMCELSGITCDVKHGNVIKIELRNRGLSGTIAEQIGYLEFLEEIDVADNDLTGFLPSDLRWAELNKLDVSNNHIRGIVPPLLCFTEDLNGNGIDDVYQCDRIACPQGSYNEKGRHEDDLVCLPCFDDTPFIGQTRCNKTRDPHSFIGEIIGETETVLEAAESLGHRSVEISLGGIFFVTLFSAALLIFMVRRGHQWLKLRQRDSDQSKIMNGSNTKATRRPWARISTNRYKSPHEIIFQQNNNSESSSKGDAILDKSNDDDEALMWAIHRYGEDHDVVRMLRMCNEHDDETGQHSESW